MNCKKQNSVNALFLSVIFGPAVETEGVWSAFTDLFKLELTGAQLRPKTIVQPLKMPARALPTRALLAILPAIVAVIFVCVACRTVHAQAPQTRTVQAADEQTVQQLIAQLSQTDFAEREAAERQLIDIGSPVVDPLIRKLLNCTPDVCSRIKRILQAVAEDCDETSLFKVLAALRVRFEVSDQRIKPLLENWAIERRKAIVDRWRKQGAVVSDPFEFADPRGPRDQFENQFQLQMAQLQMAQRLQVEETINRKTAAGSSTPARTSEANKPDKPLSKQPIAERLQLVLDGALEQNKDLVRNSGKGVAGFDQSMTALQKQPVSVIIGADWHGDYSDLKITGTQSVLPISNFEIQKHVINDSLMSVLSGHPLDSLVIDQCTVAADARKSFPTKLNALVIKDIDDPTQILKLVAGGQRSLSQIQFVNTKFGKAEAASLANIKRLMMIDLIQIDLEKDAFEGLATLRELRRVEIERCKFPAAAFLEFKRQRSDVGINFRAKAFLGVSKADGMFNREFPVPASSGGCVIGTVVAGEAADRAGMKAGDEVFNIGSLKVRSFEELRLAIAQCGVDEEVAIQIRRDGKEKTLKAKMGISDAMR